MTTRVCPICDIADCEKHRPAETETVREQRKYSFDEIEAMRGYAEDLLTVSGGQYGYSFVFNLPTKEEVECRLRTYLLAGIDPVELQAKATAHLERLDAMVNEAWQKLERLAAEAPPEKKPRGATEAELDEILSHLAKVEGEPGDMVVVDTPKPPPSILPWIALAAIAGIAIAWLQSAGML